MCQYNMKRSILRMKGRYIPILLNIYVFATGTGICWRFINLLVSIERKFFLNSTAGRFDKYGHLKSFLIFSGAGPF